MEFLLPRLPIAFCYHPLLLRDLLVRMVCSGKKSGCLQERIRIDGERTESTNIHACTVTIPHTII